MIKTNENIYIKYIENIKISFHVEGKCTKLMTKINFKLLHQFLS